MNDDEIKRLRELAQAATQGPWRHDIDKMWAEGRDVTIYSGDDYVVNVWNGRPVNEPGCVAFDASHDNARYIAAASPDVLLALLDRLERAERDAARYRYLRSRDPQEVFNSNGPRAGVWIDCEDEKHVLTLLTWEDADAAIDEAMKVGSGGTGA